MYYTVADMEILSRTIQRYLIFWLSVSSLVAFQWVNWGCRAADPFVASKPYLPWLIAVTMFAIGWMLPPREHRTPDAERRAHASTPTPAVAA